MTNSGMIERLRGRLREVEARITAACARSNRTPADVTLVAVTKTVSTEVAALLPRLGIADLGESRPQVLWKKAEVISDSCRWHLIGHLQRNKVERTLRFNPLIHSVDSLSLLTAIEHEAAKQAKELSVLLEINTSGEEQKHGFAPDALTSIIPELASLRHVRIQGLMTMAAYTEKPERCRPAFATLRELSNRYRDQVPAPHGLTSLSMGMSNDFEVAIEEGATLVRIGTALFDGAV